MLRTRFAALAFLGLTGTALSAGLNSSFVYRAFSTFNNNSNSTAIAAAPSSSTGDFCGSGDVISMGMTTGFDGRVYASAFDFTRGTEKINSKACGREYLIQPDSNKPNYGTKFVYLVNGAKNRVSQTLYVELADGSLKVFQSANSTANGSRTTNSTATGNLTSLNDGTSINGTNAKLGNTTTKKTATSSTDSKVTADATTTTNTASLTTAATTSITTAALSTTGEQAKSADAFVDSLGINIHLQYADTPYGNLEGLIKPKLQELGVRHVRDAAYQTTRMFDGIKSLGSVGIKTTLVFGGNPASQILSTVRTLKGSIEAVEGPNESDLGNKFPYNGQVFPESTRAYQTLLWNTIKGNADTKYLPVVLPSMGWAKRALVLGSLATVGDIGNMHSYPNLGNPPTDGLSWWFIPYARTIAGNTKPLWSTETGYQDLVGSELGISENVAGKYIPRIWLEQFNSGIQRVYPYELIDQKPDLQNLEPEEHYGLLRYDGSPKPAFLTLKNMISVLKEPGAKFTPGKLDYTITGDTTDLHRTLLQKSNGEFYLILWQEARSWDNVNKKDIEVPMRKVTLNLNTTITRSSEYKPFYGPEELWPKSNPRQLTLYVRDHPLIIKLKS